MGTGRSQAEGEGVAEALIPKFTPNLRWRLEAIEKEDPLCYERELIGKGHFPADSCIACSVMILKIRITYLPNVSCPAGMVLPGRANWQ